MQSVLSSEIMRDSDRYTCENVVSSRELMYTAGKEIFASCELKAPVAIVCGSGNNAGDGYVVASLIKKAGIDCSLILLSDKRSPDGQYYFDICKDLGVDIKYINDTDLSEFASVIDCIFGIGFHGEVNEPEKSAINKINKAREKGAYVISADINSGLDSDSGMGETIVTSDLTVSVGYFKSGHFLGKAKDHIKKLVNCDIGIKIIGESYYLVEADDLKNVFAERKNFSNKGDFGYVALLGGCTGYSGAVKLASMAYASMRCGAGVAKLIIPREISESVMPYILENTLSVIDSQNGGFVFNEEQLSCALKGIKSVAIGMGMGQSDENAKIVKYLLGCEDISLILDADALNTIAFSEELKACLKERKAPTLLTPHPKEFERLSGISVSDILKSPIRFAKDFALKYGLTLLLKGASTVITDGREVYIVDKGCAGMATAGSGDVLSGVLAGISGYTENILRTAIAGAYVAGLAGEYAQSEINSISMTARDTVENLPKAISYIMKSRKETI